MKGRRPGPLDDGRLWVGEGIEGAPGGGKRLGRAGAAAVRRRLRHQKTEMLHHRREIAVVVEKGVAMHEQARPQFVISMTSWTLG